MERKIPVTISSLRQFRKNQPITKRMAMIKPKKKIIQTADRTICTKM
jgi:hypothetical protein